MSKPRLGVFKFASCDGCQLSILNLEDELLGIAGAVEIAYFLEATRKHTPGRYDVSLVEGSITTAHDAERIQQVREQSDFLITIGACATAGGIQALRNFANVDEFINTVYAHPEYIETLATSNPIAKHVKVDFELRGCPIDRYQLLELILSLLHGKRPTLPDTSVCVECKLAGNPCLLVAQQVACVGPVTHAGCGALCPSHDRGCYGCFGPKENSNPRSLAEHLAQQGNSPEQVLQLLRNFNAAAPSFAEASRTWEAKDG